MFVTYNVVEKKNIYIYIKLKSFSKIKNILQRWSCKLSHKCWWEAFLNKFLALRKRLFNSTKKILSNFLSGLIASITTQNWGKFFANGTNSLLT